MEELIKYLGALLILISGTMLGWFASWSYLRRIRDLTLMKTAVNIIDNQILSRQTRLVEALEITSQRIENPIKKIFYQTAQEIKKNPDKEFYGLWKNVIEENRYLYYFTESDLQIINQWAAQIGRITLEKQKEINSVMKNEISSNIANAKNEAEKKVKLARYSGVIFSLLIIIIFY